MKKITILGSTGSIGCSALDVIEKNPQRFQVEALAAGRNIKLLKKQIEKFNPKVVAVSTKESALKLREALNAKSRIKIFYSKEGLKEIMGLRMRDHFCLATEAFLIVWIA